VARRGAQYETVRPARADADQGTVRPARRETAAPNARDHARPDDADTVRPATAAPPAAPAPPAGRPDGAVRPAPPAEAPAAPSDALTRVVRPAFERVVGDLQRHDQSSAEVAASDKVVIALRRALDALADAEQLQAGVTEKVVSSIVDVASSVGAVGHGPSKVSLADFVLRRWMDRWKASGQ
jgi:hypothetical protein